MSAKIEKTGFGSYQMEKAYNAQRIIFKTLYDGQWHRNKDLKEKTKLSSRTLNKHLTEMVKNGLVERKVNTESGDYPYPVLYKAEPELLAYMKSSLLREDFSQTIDRMLEETKDPLEILEVIHDYSQRAFLWILEEIKCNKNISDNQIEFFEEFFLWSNYKSFTFNLIEATKRKLIDSVEVNKLLIAQAKRRKKLSELTFEFSERNNNLFS